MVGGMISAMTTPAAVIVDAAAYAQAVEDAARAAAAYYAGASSPLDDDAYDRLARGIAAWEAEHPGEVLPDSPTGKVAGGAAVGDVPHSVPMLSLDNVFSPEEFTAWTTSLARRVGREVTRFAVGPKLDGLAVAARYREGRLTRLITRGDGTAGEDVSHAIGTVEGLPERLAEPVTVEVRGEILMTTAQFEHANEVRIRHGGQPFANPRNAAAGTLRARERAYTVPMTFFGYGLLALPGTGPGLAGRLDEPAYGELMRTAAGLGVHTSAGTAVPDVVVETPEQVVARVQEIAALRATPPPPADADGEGGAAPAAAADGGPLAGMKVVVTGAMTGDLERLSRNEMNELDRAGGRTLLLQRLQEHDARRRGRGSGLEAGQGGAAGHPAGHPGGVRRARRRPARLSPRAPVRGGVGDTPGPGASPTDLPLGSWKGRR
ncbi:DNA ligase [Streptomyces tendae]